jgi:NAD(P)-dependent dehydrogenase (short-subunit alcohol dehydrogenase family)
MTTLDGHAIVITGAGRGLGSAYARAAAAIGASVIVNDIDADSAHAVADDIAKAGGKAVAVPADVRLPDDANRIMERCVAEFGAITGLVNNAGIYVLPDPFEETSLEHLRELLEVNVIGVFNCARAALGPMLRAGKGSIVNIVSGAQTGQPGRSSYGATKGAVASFTYGWACELREKGIRVNAISPLGAANHPRLPPLEMNAPPVLYLLSDRSKHVTGQIIRINGTKLSLMSHPANRIPELQRESWTLDSVAEAFETELANKLLPTNVATYDIADVTVTEERVSM